MLDAGLLLLNWSNCLPVLLQKPTPEEWRKVRCLLRHLTHSMSCLVTGLCSYVYIPDKPQRLQFAFAVHSTPDDPLITLFTVHIFVDVFDVRNVFAYSWKCSGLYHFI